MCVRIYVDEGVSGGMCVLCMCMRGEKRESRRNGGRK